MPSRLLRYGGGVPLAAFDALVFDLDHTVARYRVAPLMALVHRCLQRFLAPVYEARCGAVVEALHAPFDGTVLQKGVVVDFHTGDALKVDEAGGIAVAYHGSRRLTAAEVAAKYGAGGVWPGFALLRDRKRHDSFFVLLTYFDLPCLAIIMRMVDWLDARAGGAGGADADAAGAVAGARGASYDDVPMTPRYDQLRRDMVDAFNHIFDNVEAFATGRGGFFAALKAAPADYVVPRRGLAALFQRLRAAGRHRLVLATNSHVAFGQFTLAAALGEDWRRCFDMVIFNASKPAFFGSDAPFYALGSDDATHGARLTELLLPVRARHGDSVTVGDAVLVMNGNSATLQHLLDAAVAWERHLAATAASGTSGSDGDEHHHLVAQLTPPPASTPAGAPAGTPHDVLPSAGGGAGGAAAAPGAPAPPLRTVSLRRAPSSTSAAPSGAPQTASLTDAFSADGLPRHHHADHAPHRAATPLTRDGGTSAALAAVEADVLLWEQVGHAHADATAQVIYFGDHIHGDVVPAVVDGKWSAVSVVEELEVTLPVPSAIRAGGAVTDVTGGDAGGGDSGDAAAPPPPPPPPPPPDNFDAAWADACIWGNFFEAAPASGKRSYCCAALSRFSVLAMTDLESALTQLLA